MFFSVSLVLVFISLTTSITVRILSVVVSDTLSFLSSSLTSGETNVLIGLISVRAFTSRESALPSPG